MHDTIRLAEDPHLTPLTLEEIAREDAAFDRQLTEPLWYPQFEQWVKSGMISEDDWRRYQAAYAQGPGSAPPAVGQALE